ncbi:MAG: hypothetical protein GY796_00495 [Chloroflexi bacterium]|nr:hypothetical protein [Chloroflexota bacterium]
MIKIPDQTQSYGRRWHTIFGLLSMERVVPFLDEMRFAFVDITVIRPYARQYIKTYEITWEDDGSLLQQTFNQIAKATDESTALALYDWGTNKFLYGGSEGAREFIWGTLLQRLAGVGNRESSPLPLPEDKVKAVIQIVQVYIGVAEDKQRLWDRVDAAEAQPHSEWEERIYSRYLSDTSPLDAIESTIKFHQVRRAWEQMKLMLNESELDILLQWGRLLGKEMDMPPELVQLPD